MPDAGMAELKVTFGIQTSNKMLSLSVDPSSTIESVKKTISEMESIPEEESLRVIYMAKELKDKETLASYGIDVGSYTMLVIWENSEKVLKAKDKDKKK